VRVKCTVTVHMRLASCLRILEIFRVIGALNSTTTTRWHAKVVIAIFSSMLSCVVTVQVSADELRQVGGLQVRRTVQQQGQFIVVFPQCFTARVDCGYNISDYINFASFDWLQVGLSASSVRL